jgi:hypothetical protein
MANNNIQKNEMEKSFQSLANIKKLTYIFHEPISVFKNLKQSN